MKIDDGHISRNTFKAVVGTLYAIAIVATATRLVLQVRVCRRLQIEDFFLLGACACLTAATLLTFIKFSDLYFAEVFGLNAGLLPIPDDVGQRAYSWEDLYFSAPVLAWTAIFFVKFAYLSFRQASSRSTAKTHDLPEGFDSPGSNLLVSLYHLFIRSLYLKGTRSRGCLEPKRRRMSLGLAISAIILDIITDIMILVLPVYILWRVRIKPFQKVGLGVFLTLNVWMIIIACVRAAKLHSHGFVDVTWLFFWQEMEACMAVVMISLTVFRSILSSHGMRERNAKPWYSLAVSRLKGRKMLDSDELLRLPVHLSKDVKGRDLQPHWHMPAKAARLGATSCKAPKRSMSHAPIKYAVYVICMYIQPNHLLDRHLSQEQLPSEFSHV